MAEWTVSVEKKGVGRRTNAPHPTLSTVMFPGAAAAKEELK